MTYRELHDKFYERNFDFALFANYFVQRGENQLEIGLPDGMVLVAEYDGKSFEIRELEV